MSLVDWEAKFGARTLEDNAFRFPSSTGDRTLPAPGVDLSIEATARVNAGRWIADCPFGCGGAEYVDLSNQLFFCCECRNAPVGNAPVRVALAAKDELSTIEASLLERPDPRTRNWTPSEDVSALQIENLDMGIGGDA